MTTLIVGGASSGKSRLAERLAVASPHRPLLYLATLQPFGAEGQRRVERHRRQRQGLGFETVERTTDLAALPLPPGATVLLECLGNLCANELYSPEGAGERALPAMLDGIAHLRRQSSRLILVGNDVHSAGCLYEGDTLRYLRTLGHLQQHLAALADEVIEVTAGLPVWHKLPRR